MATITSGVPVLPVAPIAGEREFVPPPFVGVEYHRRHNSCEFMPVIFNYRQRHRISRAFYRLLSLALILGLVFILYNAAGRHLGDMGITVSSYMVYSIGNTYLEQGKPAEAIKYYQQAIQKNPDMAIIYYKMALAYDEIGNRSESDKYYRKFARLKPDSKQLTELKALLNKK